MVNLTDYMNIINCDMKITYYPNQECRWSAKFDGCETKDLNNAGFLHGTCGNGTTPDEAIINYLDLIKGKILIFNSYSLKRKEFVVPENLSYSPPHQVSGKD